MSSSASEHIIDFYQYEQLAIHHLDDCHVRGSRIRVNSAMSVGEPCIYCNHHIRCKVRPFLVHSLSLDYALMENYRLLAA